MPSVGSSAESADARTQLIVEVEGYDGDSGRIVVENYRADGSLRHGTPVTLYCIASLGPDGVVRFNDWGYATAAEARDALEAEARARP